MTQIKIRGEDHALGPLWIQENSNGRLILTDRHVDYLDLGDGEEAVLVAKCIEVAAGDGIDTLDEQAIKQLTNEAKP